MMGPAWMAKVCRSGPYQACCIGEITRSDSQRQTFLWGLWAFQATEAHGTACMKLLKVTKGGEIPSFCHLDPHTSRRSLLLPKEQISASIKEWRAHTGNSLTQRKPGLVVIAQDGESGSLHSISCSSAVKLLDCIVKQVA